MLNDLIERRHSVEFYRDSKKRIKKDYKDQYERVKVLLSYEYKELLNIMYIYIYNIINNVN